MGCRWWCGRGLAQRRRCRGHYAFTEGRGEWKVRAAGAQIDTRCVKAENAVNGNQWKQSMLLSPRTVMVSLGSYLLLCPSSVDWGRMSPAWEDDLIDDVSSSSL